MKKKTPLHPKCFKMTYKLSWFSANILANFIQQTSYKAIRHHELISTFSPTNDIFTLVCEVRIGVIVWDTSAPCSALQSGLCHICWCMQMGTHSDACQ